VDEALTAGTYTKVQAAKRRREVCRPDTPGLPDRSGAISSPLPALLLCVALAGLLSPLGLFPCSASCLSAPADARVVIFSGHTSRPGKNGEGRGAKSASGVYEFRFNDAVTAFLREETAPGITIVIIPATRNVPLKQRVALAKRLKADLIIEIHHDSVQPQIYERLVTAHGTDPLIARYQGFSLHVYPNEGSIAPAAAIEERLIAAGIGFSLYHREDIPGERMELVPGTKAVYKRPNLHLPRTSTIPAVIVECGCIANPEEEKLLASPAHQKVIAQAVRQGIEDYFAGLHRCLVPK
jgi:N-acetylmuramoyl-L-alanine amidase